METEQLAWLEDVDGQRAMTWVRERSAEAEADLTLDPGYEPVRAEIQDALEADDRIPLVTQVGQHLYNVWTDAEHPRGLWRRTSWSSYRSGRPDWEVLLDLDALSAAEDEQWVWHGAQILRPGLDRALVDLSPGGSDADVTRELDLHTLEFVDDGFVRPPGKGGLAWVDRDTVFAFTDTGPGSTTRSGYAREVRRWRRGTPLEQAPVLVQVAETDLGLRAAHDPTPGFERDVVHRMVTFYDSETFLLHDGASERIEVPSSARVQLHRQWLSVELRHDWSVAATSGEAAEHTYPAGSLLVADLEAFRAGERDLSSVFTPDARTALADWTWTRGTLALTVLRDVRHTVQVCRPGVDGTWSPTDLNLDVPDLATISVAAVDEETSDDLWVVSTSTLHPMRLSVWSVERGLETLRTAPERFDASGLTLTQHWATSADGTRVPYVQAGPVAGDDPVRPTPTVLHGYGGFEVPLTPAYDPIVGRAWLARGGTYVVAGIRGGGEFGPTWHQAALRERRPRAYEDFVAVARDLVVRGVTTVAHLGCTGRSNGGLLVGNMLTRYPEDFGAIVCQVPLLDMRRYTHLLAGASWAAEYGDPDDPADWAFIKGFSPYHRLDHRRATPPVYLATSTKDDRVHPGHARKMAALLAEEGREVTYWEHTEGGHGGASTAGQWSVWHALPWTFLHRTLG